MTKPSHEERIRARLGVHFDDLGKRPDKELAPLLKVTSERVRQYRALLGIPKYRRPPHPQEDAIVTAWNQGKSKGVIAQELGVVEGLVFNILRLAARHGTAIRTDHSSTCLLPGGSPLEWTPAMIEPIRQLWLQGATMRELTVPLDYKNIGSVGAWIYRRRKAGYDFPRRMARAKTHGILP